MKIKNTTFLASMTNGLLGKCPSCTKGKLFNGYLQMVNKCNICDEKLGELPTRDTPIQIAMLIVLALIVPAILIIEAVYDPSPWFHLWFSVPVIIVITLIVLRLSKGAIAGILWFLELKD